MPARDEPYDVYSKLEDPMGVLAVALAQRETRDDTRPQPAVRRAANDAVDAIDAMLRELIKLRGQLLNDIRVSDEAAAVRADALLAGRARDQELPGASRPLDAEGRTLERPAREKGNTDE